MFRTILQHVGCSEVIVVRLLLAAAVLLAGGTAIGAADETSANRWNVLFIAVDDLRPELGCYGVREAQSPCLDAFARSALRFDRHYVQVATCGASRYALLTGRSPAASGVTSNNAAMYQGASALRREQLDGAQSLPEMFRRSGYRTVCVGKISHTPDGRVYAYDGSGDGRPEVPHGWDALPTPFGAWGRGWGAFFAYAGGRHREDGAGHQDLMEFVAREDDELPDGLIAQAAIEQLRAAQESGERFFLGVGFYKPHLPFVATRSDWEAFADVEIPAPPDGMKPESVFWHQSGEFYRYAFPFGQQRPLDDDAIRRTRRAYLACVRYVDRQIGKVLAALDETGLSDNTIVVVWGDHGWHLGDQQIWGKHSPLERALRSVLMIRTPQMRSPGTVSDALVETIDVYPTLIDLCRPVFMQTAFPLDGRSLVPVLKGDDTPVRQTATSYWNDAVSIRTDRHRLICRKKGEQLRPVELYDHTVKPDGERLPLAGHRALVDEILELSPSR